MHVTHSVRLPIWWFVLSRPQHTVIMISAKTDHAWHSQTAIMDRYYTIGQINHAWHLCPATTDRYYNTGQTFMFSIHRRPQRTVIIIWA
jgi:hypothetical protein